MNYKPKISSSKSEIIFVPADFCEISHEASESIKSADNSDSSTDASPPNEYTSGSMSTGVGGTFCPNRVLSTYACFAIFISSFANTVITIDENRSSSFESDNAVKL